jgi:flagellum-specific ATP synthase
LDGHIVLDRKIASQGRWPAIDVLASLSRLAPKAQSAEESKIADIARALIARFEDTRDLRLIGGYQAGTDAELDKAVAFTPLAYELLRQRPEDGLQPDGLAQMAKLIRC